MGFCYQKNSEYRRPSKTRHWVSTEGFWDYFFSLGLLLTKGMKMWIVFRCDNPCQFWRTRSVNVWPSPFSQTILLYPSILTRGVWWVKVWASGQLKEQVTTIRKLYKLAWRSLRSLCKGSANGHHRPTKLIKNAFTLRTIREKVSFDWQLFRKSLWRSSKTGYYLNVLCLVWYVSDFKTSVCAFQSYNLTPDITDRKTLQN